jgi:hypothetical protein
MVTMELGLDFTDDRSGDRTPLVPDRSELGLLIRPSCKRSMASEAGPPIEEQSPPLLCSFCGKAQREVMVLIEGRGVHICEECVWQCINIIDERGATPLCTNGLKDEEIRHFIFRTARSLASLSARVLALLLEGHGQADRV